MAFSTPRSGHQYPPAAFCSKYEKFLAPHGLLLPPKQVLKNKKLGEGADTALRKAFKITISKIHKMKDTCAECGKKTERPMVCGGCGVARYCSDVCRQPRRLSHAMVCENLRQEAVDQVLECLPAPLFMGREVLQGRGGAVRSWDDWLDCHTCLRSNVRSAVSVVAQWWQYTGCKDPGEAVLQAALERLVSNVFSTVLTISQSLLWLRYPALFTASTSSTASCNWTDSSLLTPVDSFPLENISKGKDVHIHLLGADRPEVSMVESGLVQVCSRVLQGYSVHLTLVAPDLANHPQTMTLSPAQPLKITHELSVGCYPGLYHNFWEDHISTDDVKNKVPPPDIAVAIHPGCHTAEMWALWRPTFQLLAQQRVPLLLTTYNVAEHKQTLKVLQDISPHIALEGRNPLGSLQCKQTPYEPDHVWAANSFAILIDNTVN